jgi:hypothetical protein
LFRHFNLRLRLPSIATERLKAGTGFRFRIWKNSDSVLAMGAVRRFYKTPGNRALNRCKLLITWLIDGLALFCPSQLIDTKTISSFGLVWVCAPLSRAFREPSEKEPIALAPRVNSGVSTEPSEQPLKA